MTTSELPEGNLAMSCFPAGAVTKRRCRHGGTRGWKQEDRKSTRLNSSHQIISYAVFCLKKKKKSNRGRHVIRVIDDCYIVRLNTFQLPRPEAIHLLHMMPVRIGHVTSASVSACVTAAPV